MILSNLNVYTEKGLIKKAGVAIGDDLIVSIDHHENLKKKSSLNFFKFPDHYSLVPGFIDLHVHGGNGSDVMDASFDAFINLTKTLAEEGTTRFLATTMTASSEHIEQTLEKIRDFILSEWAYEGAKIQGIHLEGPFLAPTKVGAQSAEYLLPLNIETVKKWQELSNNLIKIVTLAPELPGSDEFICELKKNGIIASMGHTAATYEEAINAIDVGCTHATHLFNAMTPLHRREPGIALAALLSEKVYTELIVDNVHLHPAIVQMVFRLKEKNKITLITDAMRAKCLANGIYDLGGQAVTVADGIPRLNDGTLAGSVLKMNSALKNFMQNTGCSLEEVIPMTSENAARALGIFSKVGSITVGKVADLVVLDPELNVVLTISEGKIIFDDRE